MTKEEERMAILRMIEDGKITATEGARLLAALDKSRDGDSETHAESGSARFFRVRVTDSMTGQQKVGVNIPIGLVNFGLRFVPSSAHEHVQTIRKALDSGMSGRIVDVVDDDDGQRVEIFIE